MTHSRVEASGSPRTTFTCPAGGDFVARAAAQPTPRYVFIINRSPSAPIIELPTHAYTFAWDQEFGENAEFKRVTVHLAVGKARDGKEMNAIYCFYSPRGRGEPEFPVAFPVYADVVPTPEVVGNPADGVVDLGK